jgi:hypothetical protein
MIFLIMIWFDYDSCLYLMIWFDSDRKIKSNQIIWHTARGPAYTFIRHAWSQISRLISIKGVDYFYRSKDAHLPITPQELKTFPCSFNLSKLHLIPRLDILLPTPPKIA